MAWALASSAGSGVIADHVGLVVRRGVHIVEWVRVSRSGHLGLIIAAIAVVAIWLYAPAPRNRGSPHGTRGARMGGMVWVDLEALRPVAAEVEIVAGLLAEVGPATAVELTADLDLPLAIVGAPFACWNAPTVPVVMGASGWRPPPLGVLGARGGREPESPPTPWVRPEGVYA